MFIFRWTWCQSRLSIASKLICENDFVKMFSLSSIFVTAAAHCWAAMVVATAAPAVSAIFLLLLRQLPIKTIEFACMGSIVLVTLSSRYCCCFCRFVLLCYFQTSTNTSWMPMPMPNFATFFSATAAVQRHLVKPVYVCMCMPAF